MHVPNWGMSQQLLGIAPHEFIPHLWRKVGERFKVFQPALRSDKGIIGAKQEAILQTGGSFTQQRFRNALWDPPREVIEDIGLMPHHCDHLLVPGPEEMIAVMGHKANVFNDLSGWVPKRSLKTLALCPITAIISSCQGQEGCAPIIVKPGK